MTTGWLKLQGKCKRWHLQLMLVISVCNQQCANLHMIQRGEVSTTGSQYNYKRTSLPGFSGVTVVSIMSHCAHLVCDLSEPLSCRFMNVRLEVYSNLIKKSTGSLQKVRYKSKPVSQQNGNVMGSMGWNSEQERLNGNISDIKTKLRCVQSAHMYHSCPGNDLMSQYYVMACCIWKMATESRSEYQHVQ